MGATVTFKDEDLRFLISVLMPDTQDTRQMVRVLREDAEILDGMICDERVFHRLLEDPLAVLSVSPALFFAILLARVASDLSRQTGHVRAQPRPDHGALRRRAGPAAPGRP